MSAKHGEIIDQMDLEELVAWGRVIFGRPPDAKELARLLRSGPVPSFVQSWLADCLDMPPDGDKRIRLIFKSSGNESRKLRTQKKDILRGLAIMEAMERGLSTDVAIGEVLGPNKLRQGKRMLSLARQWRAMAGSNPHLFDRILFS